MYHRFRFLHKWVGFFACLALLLISVTGFLLSTKKTFSWIRPSEKGGQKFESFAELASLDTVANSVFALGIAELQKREHIDRIDYRPKSNVFKVLSKKGYHEVQVDGTTGNVVNVAKRNDHFIEALHDFSWFHDLANLYGLPVVAVGLCFLAASGIGIFFVPVVRRWKHKKGRGQNPTR